MKDYKEMNLAEAMALANNGGVKEDEKKEISPIEKIVRTTWSKEGQEKWRKDVEYAKHYCYSEDDWFEDQMDATKYLYCDS